MANTFDFSNLKRSSPERWSVIQADKEGLELRDKKTQRVFRVVKESGMFCLSECSPGLGRAGLHRTVMRSDDLGRVLYVLGYGTLPRIDEPKTPTLPQEPEF